MIHTIIHDRAVSIIYAKVYSLCWSGNRTICFGIRPYVNGLSISAGLLFFDAGASLVDHCYLAELALVFVASNMASKNGLLLFQYFYFTLF